MTDIDWISIELSCKKAMPAFNQFRWHRIKNQLINVGVPLDAVAFIMSPPSGCQNNFRWC